AAARPGSGRCRGSCLQPRQRGRLSIRARLGPVLIPDPSPPRRQPISLSPILAGLGVPVVREVGGGFRYVQVRPLGLCPCSPVIGKNPIGGQATALGRRYLPSLLVPRSSLLGRQTTVT